jgi:hypothetical protein
MTQYSTQTVEPYSRILRSNLLDQGSAPDAHSVSADGVTVKTPEGTKTNQIGSETTPERLAKMLLRELALEGKA